MDPVHATKKTMATKGKGHQWPEIASQENLLAWLKL